MNIISSRPITRTWYHATPSGAGIAGALIDGAWVYSVHLSDTQYGPYAACFDHASVSAILAGEEKRRKQAAEVVGTIADPAPSILMGDFNTPSHLDWTEATKGSHCGYVIGWPATKEVAAGGYTDAYRAVNGNPSTAPGNTWSPWEKTNANGQPEPQDRIDYVFYKNGSLRATAAKALGTDSSWTSDHSAVVVTLTS